MSILPFRIHSDFPGGNIAIERIEGNTVYLKPDLRDTAPDWFYWYFAVGGAEGLELEFAFAPKYIGVRGPAVSSDRGVTWRWLGAKAVENGRFRVRLPAESEELRFSLGMPYVRENWERFLKAHRSHPSLEIRSLVPPESASTHDAPLLLIGAPSVKACFCVAITARHHACEMMASYVLEGIIEEALALIGKGDWFSESLAWAIAPFMDVQGVQRGDQGKNRTPHDHNRDYRGEPIYPEVRAWKRFLPEWQAGRPLIAIDLHGPALKGPYHESVFFVEPECRQQAAWVEELAKAIGRVQRGPVRMVEPTRLAFGTGFNDTPASESRAAAAWMGALPGALLGATLEIAYANASGAEVNATTARAFGRDFTRALRELLHPISGERSE